MLRIVLTGGIGSGKSTVAHFFAELGVPIIDADVIARQVTEPNTAGYVALVDHFGPSILTPDNRLDRKKLRQTIFQQPDVKAWVENTLHPLILQTIQQQISALTAAYCIIVIPLLAEFSGQINFIDRICVIDAPDHLRKIWAAQRDQVCSADIEVIMAAQASRAARLALADDVIINNQDLMVLRNQVLTLHQKYSTMEKNDATLM